MVIDHLARHSGRCRVESHRLLCGKAVTESDGPNGRSGSLRCKSASRTGGLWERYLNGDCVLCACFVFALSQVWIGAGRLAARGAEGKPYSIRCANRGSAPIISWGRSSVGGRDELFTSSSIDSHLVESKT